MLDSDDMEMVMLGVEIMKKTVPRKEWDNILEVFSFKDMNSQDSSFIRKWTWKIDEDNIFITWFQTR